MSLLIDEIENCTQLYRAVQRRDLSKVQELLENSDVDVNVGDSEDCWTPLHVASFHGDLEIVKLLVKHPGIDLNAQSSCG